ncbi:hypothetical protein R3P38DRAFT_3222360 [Favolaschia claudopus]|uniref:Uncharacterized protein n=1 Tax=Favolaschia claudopus TaxID=2862362 RepID=A0AAV9ZZ64_9AGAR
MSTWTSQSQVQQIAKALDDTKVTTSDFVITLLERDSLQQHPCTVDLVENAGRIMDAFFRNLVAESSAYAWARKSIQTRKAKAIKILTANEAKTSR